MGMGLGSLKMGLVFDYAGLSFQAALCWLGNLALLKLHFQAAFAFGNRLILRKAFQAAFGLDG